MDDKKYKLTIHVIGHNFNKIIYKYYNYIDELYEIFKVLTKLEKSIHKINILSIQFEIANTTQNITDVNRFSSKIIESKFFVDFCNLNKSKILLYDEEIDINRRFNITLDNDESFKNMDIHIQAQSRSSYTRDRMIPADP
jgi:hypothetical protein